MSATPTTVQWIRNAAQRVSRGSGRLTLWLARHITRRGADRLRAWGSGVRAWLGETSGFNWLLRAACLVVLGLIAREALLAVAGAAAHRADAVVSRLMWPASLLWLVVAYRMGREDWRPSDEQPEPVEPVEQQPEHDQVAAEPAPVRAERPLPTPVQLALALHEVGAPHAQLVPLAAVLGTTTDRVRQACAAAGIRIRGGVRMEGRSVSPGVAAEDFPPRPHLPSPARPGADEALLGGVTSNNNDNNATAVPIREGLLLITDDADNPYRHHVHHIAKG
ncbi:hypothetical protein [Streptomyces misionensis]|uniref:hypothetical protein n=1 Tax=Streptomyces misionensis TaxID=67331 RepID=UPI0036752277